MNHTVALLGSPHRDGLTAGLLARFLAEAPEAAEIDTVRAFELNFTPCDDCKGCAKAPGCVKPDGGDLFARLEKADFLIIATPVYLLSFPAPLKAIFDRFQQYYSARFRLGKKPAIPRGKEAFLIVTQGSEKSCGAQIIQKQCEMAFSVMNTAIRGTYLLSGTDSLGPDRYSAALEKLQAAARLFFRSGPRGPVEAPAR